MLVASKVIFLDKACLNMLKNISRGGLGAILLSEHFTSHFRARIPQNSHCKHVADQPYMKERVFNFSAGPATLPLPVMQRVREEFLDYRGLGASIIEISHRSKEFEELLAEALTLLRELLEAPPDYEVMFLHGGAQMQFAAVPLNLIDFSPKRKAQYVESDLFAERAVHEARLFGKIEVIASSKAERHSHLPVLDWEAAEDSESSYMHFTGNNTVAGTQWKELPRLRHIPLVVDMTSELLSRRIDVSSFGLIYAGTQKNMGPAGLAAVIIHKDLLERALPQTPSLLNYTRVSRDGSLTNTANTFAIYVVSLVLHWIKDSGGIEEMEKMNIRKSSMIYQTLDSCEGFYQPHALPADRSAMNVTFFLNDPSLNECFLQEAGQRGLYSLKGHAVMGGMRASLYNAMPLAGAEKLAEFLVDFAKQFA